MARNGVRPLPEDAVEVAGGRTQSPSRPIKKIKKKSLPGLLSRLLRGTSKVTHDKGLTKQMQLPCSLAESGGKERKG